MAIRVTIIIGSANTLRKIPKLSEDKRKLFIFKGVVKPVMILILIPLVLIVENWNFSITAIFYV
jgi:hypothetical protein